MQEETDIERLYKDACIFHFIRLGFSEYLAEVEANRILMQKNKL